MLIINLKIEKKIITVVDTKTVVNYNSDYTVHFDFDEEWSGLETKTARFIFGGKHEDVVFGGNECSLPLIKNSSLIGIGVFSGNIKSTNKVFIPTIKSVLDENSFPAPPTNDVYNQIIKRINEIEFTAAPQSDYEQADETARDYIKNRPFYEEVSNAEILPLTTLTYINSDKGAFLLQNKLNLTEGLSYVVNWNGVEYTTIAINIESAIILGNWKAAEGEGDTGEPFIIMAVPEDLIANFGGAQTVIMPLDGSETPTLSISGEIATVHKLDNKYLDLDWIPKDKYAPVDEELSVKKTYTFNIYKKDLPLETKLLLIVDGVEYRYLLTKKGNSNSSWFGNLSILEESLLDTGESFVLSVPYILFEKPHITFRDDDYHNVSLYYVVNKLPYSYLPNEFFEIHFLSERDEKISIRKSSKHLYYTHDKKTSKSSGYLATSEDLKGLATEEYVNRKIAEIPSVQLDEIKAQVEINTQAISQSGLMYKADAVDTYTERVTAEGLNIFDRQKSLLKKVDGSTVDYRNLFEFDKLQGKLSGDLNSNVNYENKSLTFLAKNALNTIGISFETGAFEKFNEVLNITDAGVYCLRVKVTDLNGKPLQNAIVRTSWRFNTTNDVANISNSYSDGLSLVNDLYYFARFDFTQEKIDLIKSSNNDTFRLYMYAFCDKNTKANFDCILSEFTFCKGDYTPETMPKYGQSFTGLKSASFGGIENKSEDGTKVDILTFPKTETPIFTTIDFERQVIIDKGDTLVLTGNEKFEFNWYNNTNGVSCDGICKAGKSAYEGTSEYVSTDSVYNVIFSSKNSMWCGYAGKSALYWIGILDILGYTTSGTQATAEEQTQAIKKFKAYLAERYANGNPVTVRYLTVETPIETPFTEEQKASGNEILAYLKGTEKVLENDGAEFGADNTLTQNYLFVTGVKQ